MSADDEKARDRMGIALWVLIACTLVFGTGVCAYLVTEQPTKPRGSAGPLFQSSPGNDPPPLIMRPKA